MEPTAAQNTRLKQDTPCSESSGGVRLTLLTIDQMLPFQNSTMLASLAPVPVPPTAVHAVALTHETDSSVVFSLGENDGVATTLQCDPFQISPKSCSNPAG